MSWLSKATGIHISPHGASLSRPDPIGTLKDIAHDPLPLLGLALPGIGSALGGVLGAIPGAGAVGSALSSIPGVSSLASLAGGGGASALGEGAAGTGLGGVADAAAGGGTGFLGSLEGLAGKAGHFLAGNGGKNAIGAASALSSYLNQQKANDYAKNALHNVEDSYNQRAPLRTQGLATLAGSQAGNPYATGKPNTQSLVGA